VAATHIALSYAQQAQFDLSRPRRAPLAPLRLNPIMHWHTHASPNCNSHAVTAMTRWCRHNAPRNSIRSKARAQTMLGFAHLTRIEIDNAMARV